MRFFVATLLASFFSVAHATIDYTIHKPYIAPRALGMGDAYVAVADDYNALFYNPAGLARLEEWQLNMFVGGELDSNVYGFYKDVDTATKSKNATRDVSNLIANNYGQHYHFRAPQLGGIWAKPRWGFGFIPADLNADIAINQQVGPSLNVIGIQDSTMALGYAMDWKWSRSRLSIGMTGKLIHRIYYAQSVLAPQLAIDKEILRTENAKEGATVDADIGVMYTPDMHKSWLRFLTGASPNLGLVVRNVGSFGFPMTTKLVNKGTASAPPAIPRVVDVGASFSLGKWWVFAPRLAMDHRNILHPNYSWRKGTHIGLDLPWKIRSWWQGGWRVGLNQGYWTAGFSGTFGIFTLDVATYGEEVGTQSAPLENRRYIARASLDF